MRIKVKLSIGIANSSQTDEIEIDDDEYNACSTDEEREELLKQYWDDWANDYIDGGWEIVEQSNNQAKRPASAGPI